jgi:amino acid adenylation domain-containing protein
MSLFPAGPGALDRATPREPAAGAAPGCAHQLFEAQAERTPGADALAFGSLRLSYAELDDRANRLARHLRELGVIPETLVGILAERSPEMVAGVLAVLKAGGAYVPLDPGYPAERLGFMWEDVAKGSPAGRPPVLLAQRHLADAVPGERGRTVFLDGDLDGETPADGQPCPDNIAYVIYTSGSTGRPKGVLVPHRGVVNVIRESERLLGIGPGDRFLQLASLGFDASVLEIFTALSTGACLVLTRRETLLSGEALGRELREQGITAIAIPPSLLDTVEELDLPALRSVIVGGEACSAATAARWAPGRRLINAYAPTEATIYATAALCSGDGAEPPPIGRPIPGIVVRLLDPDGDPVPDGELGELCLGGAGVVRGYLNRPELTAERFVPDPSGAPGERLYRSGDLSRALPSGELQFAGRVDTQVKIRGHRIELGEIEAVLGQSPEVQTAAVLARDDEGGRRLVAYVVRRAGGDGRIGVPELRELLGRKLPDYMVPPVFVFLDAMPMTPTGKVDRRALPAPGRERPDLGSELVAPANSLEAALARIWEELLGLDRVGVRDNLFELGGHSLVAAQIVTRTREDLGLDLPLRDVFEHPTVAELALRLEGLSAARGPERLPPIERAPRDQPLPLSFAQERVWFLNQLAPGSIAYNFQFTVRFAGALDPAALARTLSEIVRRHEVLRTSFPAVDGRPVQVIHPPFAAEVPQVDLAGLPEALREACAERLVHTEIRRGFDVTRIPLLRWHLVKLGERNHLLLHVEHHFVHDGWSLAVFLRELKELYTAFHAGLPSPLPEPSAQYADFAAWQRRWMRGEVLAGQLAYWKERLGGSPPPLELPTDRPRPRAHSFRGGSLRVDMPADLYRDLRAFSRAEGSTLFMTMLAAFYTLLYRYTGQEDVLLGSGIANRRLRETEAMIGMVVNTLVFRTALSGDLAFRGLLERVRETTLGAQDHQDMPFEKIVEELQPDRDLSRNPLFQVLFSFHDAPVPDLDFAGLSGYLFERHNGSAKSDLNVVVKPLAEQRVGRGSTGEELLTMVWEHSGDLFERATIERMWGHFQTLLAGLIESGAGRSLSELPLLTPAERDQLVDWNRTAAPVAPIPAHRLFAEQARRAPDALAVAAGGERLSYGEVARRASRLARRLRALGVGPESVVAVLTERSPEMVVAALGALKAGGAYLPLDPSHPAERLAFLLEDSGSAALVIRSELRDAVPETSLPVLDLGLPDETGGLEEVEVPGDGLAYVIYTSGSTGRPKGVEVPHAGLVNLIAWHVRAYGIAAEDRAALVAGPAFDASVWELWPYLAAGASLHVPDAETRAAPAKLLAWLAAERITVAFLPTPLAEAVLDLDPPADLALRFLLTGGDRLHRAPDRDLPFVLVNHYGPTEGTVVTTAVPVPPVASSQPPPIGRPIANTRVHLVDRDLRRVPAGVPGELLVAGAGLARGYRGRPDLTAERFIPDPWTAEPGGRLYRTGDLVRYLPDGGIEFLGRIDQQVKIRGYRIELGEIEAVLAGHPAVREAVAVARPGPAGASLAAYVVPAVPATWAEPEELRAFLAARLPEYMVPAAFVPLAALPLTPNGKVDLRALPEPELREDAGAGGRLAPRTPLEELLAGIWSEMIGTAEIGPHDNFFKLGGHSLVATRVLSRVRDAVQAEVPLAAFFEGPTVAELARAVEEALRGSSGPSASLRIPRRAEEGLVPLSFAQERLWFLDQLSPGASVYNIARAFRLRGRLDTAALERAAGEVVRRHETLRTTFPSSVGGPVQEIARERPVLLPVVDLSGAGEAEIGRLLQREARRPFDLRSGPLLRLLLLRLDAEEHVLALAMHHIVSDGWSMDLFFRELSCLYRAADLPELPVQYADFAVWQRERLSGDTLAGLLAYWKEQLADAPAQLGLATDRPRPPLPSFRGGQEAAALPAETARALRELARRAGATPFMLLAAALAAFFGRLTGQRDVVLGSPIAGRNRSEIEGLIGFFVNTLALRTRWEGDVPFRELLAVARRVTLAAHAHQELPFEKLVAELTPERSLGRTPLFQVMFAFQATAGEAPALPGLEVDPLEVRRDESRFDLELTAREEVVLWRYDSDLFDHVTVLRMARGFETLLAGLLADPERRLSDMPLLEATERHQLLAEWNDTRRAAPRDLTVPELFAEQVRARPDSTAVVCGQERLTYRDLDGRAGRLARRLRALGIGPERVVGLLAERSVEAVVGALAVLKTGGAYLPLDPAYPPERLAFLLEDSGAAALVIRSALRELVPAISLPVLEIDASGQTSEDEGLQPEPGRLAYVIYTSGSTGRPKGVEVSHAGLANLVAWHRQTYGVTAQDRATLLAGPAFDASVWEMWPYLAAGASLHVPDAETRAAPDRLLAWMAAEKVTISFLPTPLAEAVLDLSPPPGLALRHLLTGGDRLHRSPGQEPRFVLVNHYGPTEDTVVTTAAPVGPAAPAPLPIGRPIANTRVHLADRDLRHVPMGVAGELLAAGAGLARGYRGRPGLTAERFVPDPWTEEPGGRLYRTGDLARWRPDGQIEFLGRSDHQVKVRGFRIELGEIEAVLAEHPAVQAAVAAVRPAPAGASLVAYVVPEAETDEHALRAFLSAKLPDYMVPAVFVTLSALPLTPNGKVDRRALPEPDRLQPEDAFVPPESPEERSLAAIWCEVLGVERVGVHDDFFRLGGHSLLAAQVIARVRRDLQVDLPLRSLFQAPTVAGLAAAVGEARAGGGAIRKIARAPRARREVRKG